MRPLPPLPANARATLKRTTLKWAFRKWAFGAWRDDTLNAAGEEESLTAEEGVLVEERVPAQGTLLEEGVLLAEEGPTRPQSETTRELTPMEAHTAELEKSLYEAPAAELEKSLHEAPAAELGMSSHQAPAAELGTSSHEALTEEIDEVSQPSIPVQFAESRRRGEEPSEWQLRRQREGELQVHMAQNEIATRSSCDGHEMAMRWPWYFHDLVM